MGRISLVIISNSLQLFLLLSGLFFLLLSFRGFRGLAPAPRASRLRRFAVLVPAYNEEGGIALAVQSIAAMEYPRELFDIYVIADHCTDGTAAAAAAAGAKVLPYAGQGLKAGKGRALKWATARLLDPGYDAFCYFDADSLAHPGFLAAMNDRLDTGEKVVQGRQLPKNTSRLLSRIPASGLIISNRFFQLPKQALGLSANLHGKGFCFSADIAARFQWDEVCLTEDLEMQMRLIRHGVRIAWEPRAVVYDEQPETLGQYVCRTMRWARGALDTALRHLPGLVLRALRGDPRAVEGAVYCSQAYRFGAALLSGLLLWLTRGSFNVVVWLYAALPGMRLAMKALSLVPLLVYPGAALLLERADPRLMAAYFLQPLLGALRFPVFIAGLFRGTDFWGRTEHTSRVAIADLVE